MTTKYEKNVYLAMLAEQCSRYKEMVQFLEDMVKQRDKDLNSDERNLLSIAYKNSISGGRSAVRTIMAYEAKEKKKENSTFLPYITEYKKQVEDELTKLCQGVLKTTDEQLLKKAEDDEAKVFYIKMKGDYNRYIAEYAEGDLKKQVSDDALKAYDEATEIAKTLPVLNPIALGLALNFSVFYYEVINDLCFIMKSSMTIKRLLKLLKPLLKKLIRNSQILMKMLMKIEILCRFIIFLRKILICGSVKKKVINKYF